MRPLFVLCLFSVLPAWAQSPHAEQAEEFRHVPPTVYQAPRRAQSGPQGLRVRELNPSRRVYGFLPYWVKADPQTFRWEALTDLIYFSAEVGVDGHVTTSRTWLNEAGDLSPLVEIAHSHGVRAHLSAFVPGGLRHVLDNPPRQAFAIKELVDLVKRAGADGLDLDFEPVPNEQRDKYTAFVRSVREALDAAVPGAELTVEVYPYAPWYPGYDITALAGIADRLVIMMYNFHWKGSAQAGPLAPLNAPGETKSLTLSMEGPGGYLSLAPPEKLVMGMAYFGYDWATESASVAPSKTTGYGVSVFYKDAVLASSQYGRNWDAVSQTPWYGYAAPEGPRQTWYDDAESLGLKYDYVNRLGLAGVMLWALGYDEGRGELWDKLLEKFPPQAEPPAPPPVIPLDPPVVETPPPPETPLELGLPEQEEEKGGCSQGGSALLMAWAPLVWLRFRDSRRSSS